MPAILPARLRHQAALLAENFDQPTAYIRSLRHLLDFYANRSRRRGFGVDPPPLLETYNVQPPVIRQILHELEPLVNEFSAEILLLCDGLWAEPILEFRQIAIQLLGKVDLNPPERIEQRLLEWVRSQPERRLVETIIAAGCQRLRKENPANYLNMVSIWLDDPETFFQQVGLQALLYQVKDEQYQNLPIVFNLIQPFLSAPPAVLRPDVLALIRSLAVRSPRETAYFLRQILANPEHGDVPFLIRQSATSFPKELQDSLLDEVRFIRPRRD